ncbi:glycosyltransferase [Methyloprofundus sedimenti]|nr:glycosyltransferase [Methyloprofundus sedimenti]
MCNITAIIVTFNRLDKLKLTIEKSLSEEFNCIIIINNNSNDGSQEYLNTFDNNNLIVKHLNNNIGGAGGFNIGFEVALKNTQSDWIVCFDDDAYPQSGAIKKFKQLELDNETCAVAAAVFLPDNSISVMNRVRNNPFKSLKTLLRVLTKKESLYISNEFYKGSDNTIIDASTFVGFFIRTELIQKIGLPRKELFICADDLIYTLNLTSLGYKLLFVPSVKFFHDCHTLINNMDVYHPMWKVYYTYRNRIEMYRVSSRWLYLPVTFLQIVPWIMKIKYYENKRLFLKLLTLAIKDALVHDFSKTHPEILSIVDKYE